MDSEEWERLEEIKAVTHCKKCGTRIWKYWMNMKSEDKEFPEMDTCAPCLFGINKNPTYEKEPD
jgi:hypothetical protein